MDNDPQRHCTVPKVPILREWVEAQFGDLCKDHDLNYTNGECRICSDISFIKHAAFRCVLFGLMSAGQAILFTGMFLFLPILFIIFQVNTLWQHVKGG